MKKTINCEYCNTIFKTKSALNNHMNKAKYCLIVQKKIDEPVKEEFKCALCEKILSSKQYLEIHKEKCEGGKKEYVEAHKERKQYIEVQEKKDEVFKCEHCEKILSRKQSLLNHLNCCYKKKDKELKELKDLKDVTFKELFEKDKIIIEVNTKLENYKEQFEKQEENYKEQIKDLQDKLDKIANKAIDRPTTIVSNSTTNNNLNITSTIDFNNLEEIKNIIENKLNANHVVDGQKGIVQFLVESFLKDDDGNLKYKCTDSSRNIFKYKNANGEINKDVDANKLISYIVDGGIKVKSVEIAKEWYTHEGIIDLVKYQIMDQPQQLILTIEDENTRFIRELASRTIAN
jgi:hypothetical protein